MTNLEEIRRTKSHIELYLEELRRMPPGDERDEKLGALKADRRRYRTLVGDGYRPRMRDYFQIRAI